MRPPLFYEFPSPSREAAWLARTRQDRLTKPSGSLGRLEALALEIAAFQADPQPRARPAAALVFAADHPVTRHGVSPYPSAVTRAMLHNFEAGGAAASVLASSLDLPLSVVDVGVDAAPIGAHLPSPSLGATARVIRDAVADLPGGDIRHEDALDEGSFWACLEAGRRAVREQGPLKLLIVGEIGIGNTTVAAAIAAALLGRPATELIGAGAGASGAMLETKCAVVADALARLGPTRDPLEVLRRVGGREVVAMFGAMMEALAQRTVVLVDGFVVTAAALALVRFAPSARPGLVFGHRSRERGHQLLLEALAGDPLLDLGLCLGEASGALLSFPVLERALELHNSMATFESAGVPDRTTP